MPQLSHSVCHRMGVSAASDGSDLLWRTTYGSGEVVTTRLYDALDRLTNIATVASVPSVPSVPSIINSFSYTLDATGRRTQRHDADGARLDWDYDPFDQLTSAARTNSPNGAADAAYRYGGQYDLAGNHLHESRGQMGLEGNFNNLNQLTTRDWSGKLDVWGSVDAGGIPWEVLVNGAATQRYNGTNYLGGAALTAGSNTIDIVYQDATATNATSQAVFAPPSKPQAFQYDLNGNLLNDGYRAYFWDGENRLVAIETTPAAIAIGLEPHRSEYLYDAQWRRIQRTDLTGWNGSAYTITNTTRFVWNGWNLLAEVLSPASGVLSTNYYVWGLDLSQSLQGTGGIGGLLAVTSPLPPGEGQGEGSVGVPPAIALPCYDGNGNITDYLDASGTVIAHRDYDPFGRTIAATGPRQANFSFWFSTKPEEPWWGLYYYGYRYYSPELGRWLSRDPITDETFLSLHFSGAYSTTMNYLRKQALQPVFLFVLNSPQNEVDALGLTQTPMTPAEITACQNNINSAFNILRNAIKNNPKCQCYFDQTPRCQGNLLDRLNNLKVSIDNSGDYGAFVHGYTYPDDGQWHAWVTPYGCRLGRWNLAATIIHELMHECDDNASGEVGARGAEVACGF